MQIFAELLFSSKSCSHCLNLFSFFQNRDKTFCFQLLGELLPEVQARLVPQLEANLASWKAVAAEEEAAAATAAASAPSLATAAAASASSSIAATAAASVPPLTLPHVPSPPQARPLPQE